MLQLREFDEALLTHALTPAGPIPTLYDPEGVYPYPSYVETSRRPDLKTYRFITLENEHLAVTVCPDLGGKVYSMLDKSSGRPVLFVPESVHPVRILPRLGFIAGGIEVSFPISHTPVQLERVEHRAERVGERLYLWCGERELHSGLQYTIEYSLGSSDRFLTQRTSFKNPTPEPRSWMSWSNAAVPARADTEFHFPVGPVLAHGAKVERIDWLTQGPKRVRDLDRMTGYFWLDPAHAASGVFTPSLGQGLYHVADRKRVPGIKLWSYGQGKHELWGRAGSLGGQSYVELQAGPIRDQSIRNTLLPGDSHWHIEYWIPSAIRLVLPAIKVPRVRLLPLSKIPWFDWADRPATRYWLSVLHAATEHSVDALPPPPTIDQDLWAPRAIEPLTEALRWALSNTSGPVQHAWFFQLGAWFAGGAQVDAALRELDRSQDDRARALAGRLHLRARKDPAAAAAELRRITSRALAIHPQVVVERDLALAALGPKTLREREEWLDQLSNASDEWVIERRAALLLDQGNAPAARSLLERTPFQLVHQRYARTELWQRIRSELHLPPPPENWLGEDDLAAFGSYRAEG